MIRYFDENGVDVTDTMTDRQKADALEAVVRQVHQSQTKPTWLIPALIGFTTLIATIAAVIQ